MLSLLLNVSLQQRNMLILHQGDALLTILLLWSLFLPLGARFALDARRRAAASATAGDRSDRIVSPSSVGLFLQIVLVYFTTFLFKIEHEVWRSGYALWVTLNVDTYATGLGRNLLDYPGLLRALAYSALVIEGAGPILLLSPVYNQQVRSLTILGFLYLHIGIWLCLSIGLFQPLSVVAMFPFLPPLFWDGVARIGRRMTPHPEPAT